MGDWTVGDHGANRLGADTCDEACTRFMSEHRDGRLREGGREISDTYVRVCRARDQVGGVDPHARKRLMV
jgi:hypothetical protein